MKVDIAPELLRWAIQRVGCSETVLARRFPRLSKWLRGEDCPTLKQLERFAKATHAPFGYFFLQEPPRETVPIPDLRTVGNARIGKPSPNLLDTLYLCQRRQDWYREYAFAIGEPPLDFVGSVRPADDVVAAAEYIRTVLGFGIEERRRFPTWTDAMRFLAERADALGIIVVVNGVVCSNSRRKLDPAEFSGFVLSDPIAPLVFVNGADQEAAQMFAFAHGLAHIFLGVSALSDVGPITIPSHDVERWCSAVAAELLVPLGALRASLRSSEPLREAIGRLAQEFKVSALVLLRRIHDAGVLTREQLDIEYKAELARLREQSRSSGSGSHSAMAAMGGKRFARAVAIAVEEGRMQITEALRLLGCKNTAAFDKLSRSPEAAT